MDSKKDCIDLLAQNNKACKDLLTQNSMKYDAQLAKNNEKCAAVLQDTIQKFATKGEFPDGRSICGANTTFKNGKCEVQRGSAAFVFPEKDPELFRGTM